MNLAWLEMRHVLAAILLTFELRLSKHSTEASMAPVRPLPRLDGTQNGKLSLVRRSSTSSSCPKRTVRPAIGD
jgi:hypothetical protein